ncbi:hypothetical protein SFMTTN_0695 [Sulfuriferula multivorans]|uniref:Uncharacterized protein n=1 Tax=Sulfuriferula multivorans TaxID=1559896 RepID=A0A401JBE1_9PROT|nr:hypothetical protein SFMTTN_0695 [Sulfuriferula multivorans]
MAHARRRERRLGARVTTTNYNYIVPFWEIHGFVLLDASTQDSE